jgi:mono/diheme cytochrome c family protein
MNRKLTRLPLYLWLAAGCSADYMSEKGFSLPEGDLNAGRRAFQELQCTECHMVKGEILAGGPLPESPIVELGGTISRVQTYGDLVTSIINPSHRLAKGYAPDRISKNGESKMRLYNEVMTVQELIDIVTFLQPHYEVVIPPYAFPTFN